MTAKLVQCQLCPKMCRIAHGQSGDCRIRINLDGQLYAVTHGHPCAIHVDPIEKKPLFHFHPGRPILSIATVGCNLHCKNCQNWQISQRNPEDGEHYSYSPEQLVQLSRQRRIPMIAYTYTEPLVYYEYTLETSRLARRHDIHNVLVTAGYANPGPLSELFKVTAAANIDLKAFSDSFYRRICTGTLAPVLTALELARKHDVWLEITNLIIPTLNDDPKMIRDLCRWVVRTLGSDVPIHFSRFSPRYKLRNLPRTPDRTLLDARQIALAEGVKFAYTGNFVGSTGENTYCPRDGRLLIRRIGYRLTEHHITSDGRCEYCSETIAGVW